MARISQVANTNNFVSGQAANYSALPTASAHSGEIWVALAGEGVYLVNRKSAGLYYSNGTAWGRLGNIPAYFDSSNFQVYDNTDNTKIANFDVSNISTGTTRTITMPDADVDLTQITAPEKTYTVSPSGGDYATIQAALDANTSGGELFLVYPGTYANDTIAFTANNQCVVGAGTTSQQIVTQADANICDFAAYTGCRVSNIKMQLTAATSAIFTVTGSTGSIALRDCHVECTNSNVTAASQPGCISVTGAGTLNMKRGTIDYNNAVAGASAIKQAISVGTGATVNLDFVNIDVDGAGASTAIAVTLSAGTGVANINDCYITLDDAGTGIGAGYYFSGSGTSEFYRNEIHVTVGSGTGYGAFISGTVNFRSFYNHIHVVDSGGSSYSFLTDTNATVTSQLDDIIADDGVTGAGTFIQASSDTDGTLDLCSGEGEKLTICNTTKEDTDGGRESIITFKGRQSGGEKTTLAKIQASHDGTSDDQKGDLIFQTNDGSDGDSPTERLRIDSAGNAGIGTSSPLAELHIESSGDPELRIRESGNNANSYFRIYNAADSQTVVENIANTGVSSLLLDARPLDNTSNGVIQIGRQTNTSGANGLYIHNCDGTAGLNHHLSGGGDSYLALNNGNVGIGTSSPSAKLEVDGEARYTATTDMGSNDEDFASKKYVDDNAGGGGSNEYNTKETTANYTILDDDGYRIVYVNSASSNITITLPTLADNTKRVITIHNNTGVIDATCDTTSGSTTATMDDTSVISAGMNVYGNNVNSGTTVASITNSTTFELSANANKTETNCILEFANTVTVDGEGAETIDGMTTIELPRDGDRLKIQAKSDEWKILDERITCQLVLDTYLGYGDTDACIMRFTNNREFCGNYFSQNHDSGYSANAKGLEITINKSGKYCIEFYSRMNSGYEDGGISLNSTQLSTGPASLNAQDILCAGRTIASYNDSIWCTTTRYFKAGDIIRPHTDGGTGSVGLNNFTVSYVGN